MPVRLALARARPKIIAVDDKRFFRGLASFIDDGNADLLTKRRNDYSHAVLALLRGQRVGMPWLD